VRRAHAPTSGRSGSADGYVSHGHRDPAACVNRSCPTRGHVSGVVEDDAIIRLAERPVRPRFGACLGGRRMR